MKNEMRLFFDAQASNEAFARTAVAAFIVQLDPTLEEISDIKTALSEAVTNAIVHGYGETAGIVEVHCVTQKRHVTVSVTDTGVGIADIKQAMEPMYTGKPEAERSGMGFTVMEAFMDAVTVRSSPGEGTTVLLEKQLRAHESIREKLSVKTEG